MFRIDDYCEAWAQKFKPISHNPERGSKDKAFYRMDSITRLEEFAAGLAHAKSPSMAVVTQIDGEMVSNNPKFIRYTHRVFFFVKQAGSILQNSPTDEVAAANAKYEGVELVYKLIAYMFNDKTKNKNTDLEGMDFNTASIISVPQKFNGWWPTELVIEHIIPRQLCVSKEDYK